MTLRTATPGDAKAMAAIYNAGIAERVATFETEPREPAEIEAWFGRKCPIVVVEIEGEIAAFAASFPYSDRCCYGGIAEFSVYVSPRFRRFGAGRLAMQGLIDEMRRAEFHKLVSRVFPENVASRQLLKSVGFQEVGVHRFHGKLDGVWRDAVIVERIVEENL